MDASMTYGERMLVRLEFRAARRRRLILLAPGLVATFWALADLVAARHMHLTSEGAGFIRHLTNHVPVVAWTVVLVAGGLAVALKPRRIPAGALVAILAGPVLTPRLFGAGGWHLWQAALFLAAAIPALSRRIAKRAA